MPAMDYREKIFKDKFNKAARYLGVAPAQIVSIKFREMVSSYSEYHELLNILERDAGISYHKLNDSLSGTGYLLNDSHSKVILIEHESGLEILYIAGSIASIISLIPLISNFWNNMRSRLESRHRHDFRGRDIEIRKLDNKGHLKEDNMPEMEMFGPGILSNSLLVNAVKNMENEIVTLRKEIEIINRRIKLVENRASKSKHNKIMKKKSGE